MPNLTPLPELKHAGDPRLIEGVYNYCDRWCDRCRFQERCILRCDERHRDALIANGVDPGEAYQRVDDAHERAFENLLVELPASQRLERERMLSVANRELTPEEEHEIEETLRREDKARESHPLVRSSKEYSQLAHDVLTVIGPIAESRHDDVVLAALETISWFSLMVAVKTARAVIGLVGWDGDADEWLKSDANGTAKLTRLIIAESIEAWRVLMSAGHGAADGVPAAMIARLEKLDAGLAETFPRAMEFVRAGFDDTP